MPSRIVREGILESERMQRLLELGGWEAEVFYRRLHQIVDDYGRYSADPRLLRPRMYPLALEQMREANVSRCLKYTETAGLVRLYRVGAKQYLEVLDFKQRTRADLSKFPDPPNDGHVSDTCPSRAGQMHTYAETYSETKAHADDSASGFAEFWAAWPRHPRKVGRSKCLAKWKSASLAAHAPAIQKALAAARASPDWLKRDGEFIPQPLTWLNKTPWETDPEELESQGSNGADPDNFVAVHPSAEDLPWNRKGDV